MSEIIVDARGYRCPLPVLRAQKALRESSSGTVVIVLADDDMAAIDLPHMARQAGHDHLGMERAADGHQRHRIRRA